MTDSPPSKPVSVWHYKPWWCQPWSILLTGTGIIGSSWLLGRSPWITLLVALPILVWMGFFLIAYPQMMQPLLSAEAPSESLDQPHREGEGKS